MVPASYKEANICPIPKKVTCPFYLIIGSSPFLTLKVSYLNASFSNICTIPYILLSSLQAGFIPGDSTANQLTYLYNTFCQALNDGKEVRVVFYDINKAFDRVWHAGLLLKLEAAGVTGEVLAWFKSYLFNRKQRVVLPGDVSDWNFIHAGVPQSSILGTQLFLLYTNAIVLEIGTNIRLFADDTSLFIIVDGPATVAACIKTNLSSLTQWAATWVVTFNLIKTESMLISRRNSRKTDILHYLCSINKYPKLTHINIWDFSFQKTARGMNILNT